MAWRPRGQLPRGMSQAPTATTIAQLRRTIGAFLYAFAISGGVSAAELDVEILGFSDDTGQARVLLYTSPASYGSDTPDAVATAAVTARTATVRFLDVQGNYALIAHHDRDGDGRFDKAMLGVPMEPLGFSRGVWPGFARPDWAQVSMASENRPPVQPIWLRTHPLVALFQMLGVGLPSLLAVFAGLAAVRFARTFRSRHD